MLESVSAGLLPGPLHTSLCRSPWWGELSPLWQKCLWLGTEPYRAKMEQHIQVLGQRSLEPSFHTSLVNVQITEVT